MSGKKKSKTSKESEELNWPTGLSRWMGMKGPDGQLPEGINDPALVAWVENQRRDYWQWKQGRDSTMEKEAFDMLETFGFDWGDEAEYGGQEEEDDATDEEEDLDRKPKARKTASKAKPKARRGKKQKEEELAEDDEEGSDDEPEPPRKAARTSTRKSPRDSVRIKDEPTRSSGKQKAAKDKDEDADFDEEEETNGRKRRRSSKSSSISANSAAKRVRKPAPKEETELRTMVRIVPVEQEPELIEQVKKECKDLLVCAEPLEEDKEAGVLPQDVRFNLSFEQKFLEFLVFCRAYGHPYVPKIHPDNPALGRWCCKIRHWRNTDSVHLTESRINRLDTAGFVWNPKNDRAFWRVQTECVQARDLWEENFKDLLAYKEEKGNVLVPKEYQANKRLARWVLKQRRSYKSKHSGEYHTLDDEKEQRLIDIGFVFNSRTPELMRQNVFERFKDKWAENIEKLRQFREIYGHGAIPRRWKTDPALASWAMRQRAQWRKLQAGKPSYLTPERLAELEEAGFIFGDIDRRNYPVDACGVWPKPYQLKKRNRKNKDDDGLAEEAAKVVAATLGSGSDEEDADEKDDGNSGEGEEEEDSGDGETDVDLDLDNEGQGTADHDGTETEGGDAVAEEVLEEQQEHVAAPVVIKGRWVCGTCSKDEFLHFIDACAHEAACSGMQFAVAESL